eukprot:2580636-Amphidinium_carterae.1
MGAALKALNTWLHLRSSNQNQVGFIFARRAQLRCYCLLCLLLGSSFKKETFIPIGAAPGVAGWRRRRHLAVCSATCGESVPSMCAWTGTKTNFDQGPQGKSSRKFSRTSWTRQLPLAATCNLSHEGGLFEIGKVTYNMETTQVLTRQ